MTTTTIEAPSVNDSHRALNAARDTLEDLRTRAASGDLRITGDQLTKARAAVELAELRLAAAVSAAEVDRANQREADVEALRQDIAAFDTTVLDGARANYAAAVEALRFLTEAVTVHEAARSTLLGRCNALGLSPNEVPYDALNPRLHDYAALALQDAAGGLRGAHALSSDSDAAAASQAAAKAGARSSLIRVRRDFHDARQRSSMLRGQASAYANSGDIDSADEMLARAEKADAEVERLAAEVARLDALAA